MARTSAVDLPSGLSVVLRVFMVEDEDLLADPKLIREGLAITHLLSAATVEVTDAGPYTLRDGGKLNWNDVLQGDRMVALLKNRIATWGKDMPVRQPCPNCQQIVELDFDLEQLKIKELPESSRDHVVRGTPLVAALPGGAKVGFKLLRGSDERALNKIQKEQRNRQISSLLRYRITSIEGVPQNEWPAWLRQLDSGQASDLRAAMDEHDCGIEQEFDFDCRDCSFYWREDVKLRADFLFPKSRKKTSTNG